MASYFNLHFLKTRKAVKTVCHARALSRERVKTRVQHSVGTNTNQWYQSWYQLLDEIFVFEKV